MTGFRVTDPDPRDPRVRAVEDGPQHPCWQGDEQCAFYPLGACTAVPCSCETLGHCLSCRPTSERRG